MADQPPPAPADGEVRRRRLERLASRRAVAPPVNLDPAHGRALRARAAATDRDARFAQRLEEVGHDARRRARLARAVRVGSDVATVLVGLLMAVVLAAVWTTTPVAVAVGVAVIMVLWGARRLVARRASSRGAEAWDWQAGRHRLLGNPSARVRSADTAPATDPRGRP